MQPTTPANQSATRPTQQLVCRDGGCQLRPEQIPNCPSGPRCLAYVVSVPKRRAPHGQE